jgi:hypothetical protein
MQPIKLYNYSPKDWGEPGFIVQEDINGNRTPLDITSNRDSMQELFSQIELDEYEVESISIYSVWVEDCWDVYPIDDPGYCFYEFFQISER